MLVRLRALAQGRCAVEELRGEVGASLFAPGRVARVRLVPRVAEAVEAEARGREVGALLAVEDDVRRADVQVEEPVPVRPRERPQEIDQDPSRLAGADARAHPRADGLALDVLHDGEGHPRPHPDVVHGEEALEPAEGGGQAEPLEERGGLRALAQDAHRDLALERRVEGAVGDGREPVGQAIVEAVAAGERAAERGLVWIQRLADALEELGAHRRQALVAVLDPPGERPARRPRRLDLAQPRSLDLLGGVAVEGHPEDGRAALLALGQRGAELDPLDELGREEGGADEAHEHARRVERVEDLLAPGLRGEQAGVGPDGDDAARAGELPVEEPLLPRAVLVRVADEDLGPRRPRRAGCRARSSHRRRG